MEMDHRKQYKHKASDVSKIRDRRRQQDSGKAAGKQKQKQTRVWVFASSAKLARVLP